MGSGRTAVSNVRLCCGLVKCGNILEHCLTRLLLTELAMRMWELHVIRFYRFRSCGNLALEKLISTYGK